MIKSNRVFEVFSKVLNLECLSSFLEVVVDPSNQNLVGWKLDKILKGLSVFFVTDEEQLWSVLEVKFLSCEHLECLPDKGEDLVRNLLDEIVWLD